MAASPTLAANITVEAPPESAGYSYTFCSANATLSTNSSISVTESVSGDTATWTTTSSKPCLNGCSYTLNTCRPDGAAQGLMVIALLSILAVILYAAPRLGPLGYLMAAVIITFSLLMASAWDFFSDPWLFLLRLALPISVGVYIIFHYLAAKPEDMPAKDVEE